MFVIADVKLSNCVDYGYSGVTRATCFYTVCRSCNLPTRNILVLLLSYSLLSTYLRISIFRTIILPYFVWVWNLVDDIEGGT
jgi:hypothetical protein